MDAFERMIEDKGKRICPQCKGFMVHDGINTYKCIVCGYEELDDFGKVKEFLEKNGPTPIMVISEKTGVKRKIIEKFLKEGRVEIPEGSEAFIQCEKCGAPIRYGRYCPNCARELANGVRGVFVEGTGEVAKKDARMHYLNHREDRN